MSISSAFRSARIPTIPSHGPVTLIRASRANQNLLLPNSVRGVATPAAEGGRAAQTGRRVKLSHAVAVTTVLCTTAYLVGLFAPPALIQLVSPRPAPPPPPADSEEGRKLIERIDQELNNLELLRKCRENQDDNEWYEVRPHLSLPEERRVNSLTAGALRGPGKIAVPPIVRSRKDESESWIFIHLGRAVCGHDGIVHGGLLATLLDEALARIAILNLPSRLGVTANLNINFRAPTKAEQFVVLKVKLVEHKGRKATVEGRVEDLDGTVLAEAKALFIEPKLISQFDALGGRVVVPSWEKKVAQMVGVPAAKRTPGGAQVIDIDVDEAERQSAKGASKKA